MERETYETDGALALKPSYYPEKPNLKLLNNSSSGELPPSNIISFKEFKTRKYQELISQKMKLMPKAPLLRNLRQEVLLTSTKKAEPEPPKIETEKTEVRPASAAPDLLKGTGFTAAEEMNSLKTKYNEGLSKGEDPKELASRIITENLTNIRWYQWEYTMSDPIIPNPVAQNENGELVNSKSGYSVVDMTDDKERDGSVKTSVVRAQELLKDAKEGDTVMIISPPGWTARRDERGKEIEYPEAEIFAFIKGEGRNIRALTFVSELTIEQCQQLKDHFITPDPKAQNKKQTEREKIMDMVANPVLVAGGKVRFEDILDRVEVLKGGKIMRSANGANRTFAEAREFLKRGDELQKLPDLCEEIIQTYEKYLRENIENINDPNVFAAINQRMQLTVLEIAKTLKGDRTADAPKEVSFFYKQAMASTNVIDSKFMQNNYGAQIAYLRTRPGCNGGGSPETSGIFGSTLSEVLSGNSTIPGGGFSGESSGLNPRCIKCKLELCEGRCPNCEKKAARAA